MNLEEQWKQMDNGDEDLSSLIKKGVVTVPSKDPLEKIKRNLLINSVWGLIITAGYLLVLVKFPVWQVLVCIGMVFLFTLWAVAKTLLLYREMKKPMPHNTLLQEMERHYKAIQSWMTVQEKAALLIYPISAAGGFMIGGSLGAGKSIDVVISKPIMLVSLVITIAILTPICIYLAKWLNKKAFGRYAAQLKQNIDNLKAEQ